MNDSANLFLIVIICQLAWIIHRMKKPEQKPEKTMDYQKIIPDYIGKQCELILKKPLYELGNMFSITGTVLDCDEVWVLVEERGEKPAQKLLRISNIRSIKEITT